jgi:group I intron endonuclease
MLRFRRHQIDLINNKHQNIHLQRAWNKYGKENFNFTIHCKCLIEHLDIEEQKCLDLVKSSPKSYYNMGLDVNSPRRGLKFSEESRKKMSNSAKQKFVKFPSLKEKIYTKERNQKIRISKQGSKNYNFGKKLESEETKQKLRAATTGHNNPFFDHNIYTFSHQSHGVIKSTQYDLYTKYNLHKSHVGHIIKGTRKSHHGWKIIYE